MLFKRPFHAARETLSRYESQDLHPHTAGQIRAVVGGVLYADGLVGLKDPSDARNQLSGIRGSLLGAGVGLVFVVSGSNVVASAANTDTTTTGTIASVSAPYGSRHGSACSLSADFEVAGQAYVAISDVSSDENCRLGVGESIPVRFNSANPDENSVGRSSKKFGLLFSAIGALAFVASTFTLVIGLASILLGLRLLRSGRRMMAENPKATIDEDGVVEEAKRTVTNMLSSPPRRPKAPSWVLTK